LQDAHGQVARQWPGRHASAEAFRAYHEYAARTYQQAAQIDTDHHHEALYWAQQARHNAEEFGAQITSSATPTDRREPGTGAGAKAARPARPSTSHHSRDTKEQQ
jgi:hypothetical protein